jgi:putative transposase
VDANGLRGSCAKLDCEAACARHRRRGSTRRGKRAPAEDLVKRNFVATEVDRVWVADITYVATAEGFLYVAFILEVHSRRIVGWAIGEPPED